jgi:hypothetical protein
LVSADCADFHSSRALANAGFASPGIGIALLPLRIAGRFGFCDSISCTEGRPGDELNSAWCLNPRGGDDKNTSGDAIVPKTCF